MQRDVWLVMATIASFFPINLFATEPEIPRRAAIAVIMDDRFEIYRQVLTGIAIESKEDLFEYSIDNNASKALSVLQQAVLKKPRIIIAVGPKAAVAARKHVRQTPVIVCMVPHLENHDMRGANLIGIRMEPAFRAQLTAIKALFSSKTRLGIVYSANNFDSIFRSASSSAERMGFKIIPIQIEKADQAANKLGDYRDKIDVLWMIHDPIVLNLSVANAMTQFSLNNQIPFWALNDSFVARGALMSLSIDYVKMGLQVGKLAMRIVQDTSIESVSDVIAPQTLSLVVNLTTARQIKQYSSLATDLFSLSADQGYAISVIK